MFHVWFVIMNVLQWRLVLHGRCSIGGGVADRPDPASLIKLQKRLQKMSSLMQYNEKG